jgi:hypothetical protein
MYDQALTFLFKALAEYFEYQSKAFYRNSFLDSYKRQDELIAEIERLRQTGLSADADRADFLRTRLQEEREFVESLKHISTKYINSSS